MKQYLESILHPKYEGEERIYKLNSIVKLSLDSVFYASTTVFAYYLFREQYWFPSIVGGCGQCGQIYKETRTGRRGPPRGWRCTSCCSWACTSTRCSR